MNHVGRKGEKKAKLVEQRAGCSWRYNLQVVEEGESEMKARAGTGP